MNKNFATSLTTGLFIVMGTSGIMLFFKLFDMQVKQLHEILGLGFIVAVSCHLFYNWKSMRKYFSKKIFILTLIGTALITSSFVLSSINGGENPKKVIIEQVIKIPLEYSVKIFELKLEDAIDKLEDKNMKVNESNSIGSIAKQNNTNPFKIISILVSQ
ncbi:MAG: DUF4405 domain-containing protein [Campylobacteraceae bacterium]|nr:DUF4405 domain-containing protein [Campylobacteraceae bacterium]